MTPLRETTPITSSTPSNYNSFESSLTPSNEASQNSQSRTEAVIEALQQEREENAALARQVEELKSTLGVVIGSTNQYSYEESNDEENKE